MTNLDGNYTTEYQVFRTVHIHQAYHSEIFQVLSDHSNQDW